MIQKMEHNCGDTGCKGEKRNKIYEPYFDFEQQPSLQSNKCIEEI